MTLNLMTFDPSDLILCLYGAAEHLQGAPYQVYRDDDDETCMQNVPPKPTHQKLQKKMQIGSKIFNSTPSDFKYPTDFEFRKSVGFGYGIRRFPSILLRYSFAVAYV